MRMKCLEIHFYSSLSYTQKIFMCEKICIVNLKNTNNNQIFTTFNDVIKPITLLIGTD